MSVSEINSTIEVELRPVIYSDVGFLKELYASTRYDIDRTDMTEDKKKQLKAFQFFAQHQHYRTNFPNASFDLIVQSEKPIGRVYVNETNDEVRLIDIALMPETRGCGIGEKLIREIQRRASECGLPLRLRVEPDNPALRLYERLGFKVIADEQVNLHLEWTPVRIESRS